MADDQVTKQTIEIDTSQAYESIADVTRQLLDMTKYTAQAQEGIQYIGNEYKFTNAELQNWYDTLQKMGLAHNKVTTDIIKDLQDAARAANTAATATEEYGTKVSAAVGHATGAIHTQKLAFEDIGRLALGEKIGLRQFAQGFGEIGAVASIAAFAIYEYGGQIIDLIKPLNDTEEAQKRMNEVVGKSAEKAAEATINVEEMNQKFKDASTIEERKTALDEYNKKFGETIGYAKDLNEAEKILKEHTADYITIMDLRAREDAAAGLQKAKLAELQKLEVTGELGTLDKIKAGFISMIHLRTSDTEARKAIVDENIKDAKKEADAYGAITVDLQKKADDLQHKVTQGHQDKPDNKKGQHDNSLEEQKRYVEESQKITENAEQKEITSEQIKYDKIRADLVAHHHSTEALDEQHEQNVADIHKRYADKLAAEFAKEAAKAKEEDAKLTAEFLKEQAKLAEEKEKAEKKSQDELDKLHKKSLADRLKLLQTEMAGLQGNTVKKRQLLLEEQKDLDDALKAGIISQADYQQKTQEIKNKGVEIDKSVAQQQKQLMQETSSLLDQGVAALGASTAAGKDLAIASATIKALQAEVTIIAEMSQTGPFGFAAGIVASAAVGVGLFETIKKIESTKIPGASGGGSSVASPSTISGGGGSVPGAPTIPKSTATTNLSPQSINKLNQQKSQEPIKAVVVESDITSSQQRMESYRQGSSLH